MPRTEPSKEALEAAAAMLAALSRDIPIYGVRGRQWTRRFAFDLDAFAAAAVERARNAALDEAARLVDHHPFADDADEGCRDSQGCCEALAAQIRALKS